MWCWASRTARPRVTGRAGADPGGMNLPTGVLIHDGRLVVADAWHHRILVWDTVPRGRRRGTRSGAGPADASSVQENRGGECSASTFYWPFGIALVGSTFWVADTGNRRLLGWRNGIPDPDQAADIVPGPARPERPGGEPWRRRRTGQLPLAHDITGNGDLMLVADAGGPPDPGLVAPAFRGPRRRPGARPSGLHHRRRMAVRAHQRPVPVYAVSRCRRAGAQRLGDDTGGQERSDSGIDTGGQERSDSGIDTAGRLAVADTANNRVLLWDGVRLRGPAAAPTTCWLNPTSAPTARTAGPRCSATRCAGRMGCPCAATPWQSPTPETTG